jgi:16S rRNA (uracil1498-N3)-methyltransferase
LVEFFSFFFLPFYLKKMSLPIFFSRKIENGLAQLEAEEAGHCIAVMRKKLGDKVAVVDGNGSFFDGEIAEINKKTVSIRLFLEQKNFNTRPFSLHIACAPTKNLDRFEWFLEKTTEIGIEKITPIKCRRSERTTLRTDRCEKILVAAMKQSLHASLPEISELIDFQSFIKQFSDKSQRFIAYCNDENLPSLQSILRENEDAIILIGPEGDFAPEEIDLAQKSGFVGINLGKTRLRTETAGVVACHTFALKNA